MGPGLALAPAQAVTSPAHLSLELAFVNCPGYPPRGLLKLDRTDGVTCPGPSAAPRYGPSLATGHRPWDHARPGGSGPGQPMGWRRPHDPRREGVGRQAGRARRRAESPPPPLPGREVSRRGPQCKVAGERSRSRLHPPPHPQLKHGCRQGKRGGPGAIWHPAGMQPGVGWGVHAGLLHLAAAAGHRGPHLRPHGDRGPIVP